MHVNGKDCDTVKQAKKVTGMKYSEMLFNCYTPKKV